MKKAIVCGGAGFIGHHLCKRLKDEGYYVISLDIKKPEFSYKNIWDEFNIHDCSTGINEFVNNNSIDEVYQLAADMGGAGYIFTGENDAAVMSHSAQINIQVLNSCVNKIGKIFYSSSACIYPKYNQEDPLNPKCSEDSAYPAAPDSEYGWEKLFSERLYAAFAKNFGLKIAVARFHNIYGPECTYQGGKEKAVLALCRKVLHATDHIEVWGPGSQTRSFLYINDCIDGVRTLMNSKVQQPLNIGSEEMITINGLATKIMKITNKNLEIRNISGPVGVNGRNSDNKLVEKLISWKPKHSLDQGLEKTINWLKSILVN